MVWVRKLRNFLVLLFNTRRDVPKVVEYDLHHNNNTDHQNISIVISMMLFYDSCCCMCTQLYHT